MSFTVVVVAEDPTHNGYILCPIVTTIMGLCGKPRARVTILANPRTSGYEHAKGLLRSELFDRYKFVDLILFLPDADGKDRAQEFAALEAEAATKGARLICCAAQQEVETWLLAGHVERLTTTWSTVRQDASVKENVFAPFLQTYGDARKPGGGREDLMWAALANFEGIRARCPELAVLQDRICDLIAAAT